MNCGRAPATLVASDFSGSRKLKRASGKPVALGMVLYNHDAVVSLGDRLFIVPFNLVGILNSVRQRS
jgi:hypothetical protein